jgi:hypothetical protein
LRSVMSFAMATRPVMAPPSPFKGTFVESSQRRSPAPIVTLSTLPTTVRPDFRISASSRANPRGHDVVVETHTLSGDRSPVGAGARPAGRTEASGIPEALDEIARAIGYHRPACRSAS